MIQESRFALHHSDSKDFLKNQQPANSVDAIFTSPNPIRTYADFIDTILILGQECKRVLKPTGSMWVHMEDAYNERGSLMRWPAKFSMEMVTEYDWVLRAERIWHAPVGDQNFYNEGRVIDNNRLILDHSYCFHFTCARYGYYNSFDSFGGQPCSIFTEKQRKLGPDEYASAFSMELVKQSLLMSCPKGGTVMDPFMGSGTTGVVTLAMKDMGYNFIGIEKDERRATVTTQRLRNVR